MCVYLYTCGVYKGEKVNEEGKRGDGKMLHFYGRGGRIQFQKPVVSDQILRNALYRYASGCGSMMFVITNPLL